MDDDQVLALLAVHTTTPPGTRTRNERVRRGGAQFNLETVTGPESTLR